MINRNWRSHKYMRVYPAGRQQECCSNGTTTQYTIHETEAKAIRTIAKRWYPNSLSYIFNFNVNFILIFISIPSKCKTRFFKLLRFTIPIYFVWLGFGWLLSFCLVWHGRGTQKVNSRSISSLKWIILVN